jgi:diguanylate cyclase (GGDEF)-like protein
MAGQIASGIAERCASEERVRTLAYQDPLTGLPNRTLLLDRLEQALVQAQRGSYHLALLFLDLDRFKTINDTLGHMAGDELLRQAGVRLKESLRDGDTVARLGGDEFVVLLPRVSTSRHAGSVAEKVLATLGTPFAVSGHELYLSGSLGISIYPRDGNDPETILKHADTALYRAKEEGRGQYQFFDAGMNLQARERLWLEHSLRGAVGRGELVLHYQPQVDLSSGEVSGAEALVRWLHPERGMIVPAQFIPIAEETGMITELGGWVLLTACRQAANWRDAGLGLRRIAVNLSVRQLRQPNFAQRVGATLAETGLPAESLELEITESSIMADPKRSVAVLRELHAMGVQLAVDDFGTGYSSFGYLKRLPLHRIKIDRSFVQDIPTDPDDAAIVQAMLAMARQLGIGVVAEGVETAEQCRFLSRHHCDEAQGYAFSRPLSVEALDEILASPLAWGAAMAETSVWRNA